MKTGVPVMTSPFCIQLILSKERLLIMQGLLDIQATLDSIC